MIGDISMQFSFSDDNYSLSTISVK